MTTYTATLNITAASEEAFTAECVRHLTERGYAVAQPNETWETPVQFVRRLGMDRNVIARALARPGCPNVAQRRSATGRLLELCSNAHFDAFVVRFRRNG